MDSRYTQEHRDHPPHDGGISRRQVLASLGLAGLAAAVTVGSGPAAAIGSTLHESVYGPGGSPCPPLAQHCCINVKHYGATGDGASDDTASIQAAIDAVNAQGGGCVYVPGGTYMISATLTLYSHIALQGDGDASIIKATTGGWGVSLHGMIDMVGVRGAMLIGLCLHQNGSQRTPGHHIGYIVLMSDAEDCLIDNVTFADAGLNPEYGQPSGPALGMFARDSLTENTNWGGVLGRCCRTTIRRCRFIQPGTARVGFAIRVLSNWILARPPEDFLYYNEGHVIEQCHFHGEYSWNMIEFAGGGTRYNQVVGCTFEGRTLTAIDFDKGASYNTALRNDQVRRQARSVY